MIPKIPRWPHHQHEWMACAIGGWLHHHSSVCPSQWFHNVPQCSTNPQNISKHLKTPTEPKVVYVEYFGFFWIILDSQSSWSCPDHVIACHCWLSAAAISFDICGRGMFRLALVTMLAGWKKTQQLHIHYMDIPECRCIPNSRLRSKNWIQKKNK